MARVEITHKCIMTARKAAQRDSKARETGVSLFIKRYYGKYKLLAVEVSERQRSCRDMFAEAQKMAHEDLENWNRKRHRARLAKKHKKKGAHRMAVSYYYKLLKENGGELKEEMKNSKIERSDRGDSEVVGCRVWKKMGERSAFCGSKHKRIDRRYRRIGEYSEYSEEEERLVG